jgi:hypothetical protein
MAGPGAVLPQELPAAVVRWQGTPNKKRVRQNPERGFCVDSVCDLPPEAAERSKDLRSC